jgi:hypothetical protein
MAAHRSFAVCLAMLAAVSIAPPAAAQTVAKPAEAAKPGEAQAAGAAKSFEAGTKAFENGKAGEAIAALSSAITSGGLANPDLAKALFYRGVAQRREKKPGAALSDLNAAVWLRDGLSATDRAVAEDHRQALLREVAGLNAASPVPGSQPVAAVEAAPPVPAAAAPVDETVVAAAPPANSLPPTPNEPLPWSAAPGVAAQPAPPVAQTVAASAPAPAVNDTTVVPAVSPVRPVATAAVEEKPLPWAAAPPANVPQSPSAEDAAVAQPSATTVPDTIADPVATVSAVERATIATVDAAPAPPAEPVSWQTAAAGTTPPVEPPLPWTAAANPEPADTAPTQPAVATASVPAPNVAGSTEAAPPTPTAVSAPMPGSPATAEETPTVLASATKAAGTFFGNIFSGNSTGTVPAATEPAVGMVASTEIAPPASPAPIATAFAPQTRPEPAPAVWTADTQTAPAPPPAQIETASIATAGEAPSPAAARWPTATQAVEPPPAPVRVAEVAPPLSPTRQAEAATPMTEVAVAAAASPGSPLPAQAALPGPYRLQIAAENSRDDAEKTLTRLRTAHGTSLRGLEPVIEEPKTGGVLFGSMGAAYRVSIGPYAQSAEPGRLCNILQPHGFDCRVVATSP